MMQYFVSRCKAPGSPIKSILNETDTFIIDQHSCCYLADGSLKFFPKNKE